MKKIIICAMIIVLFSGCNFHKKEEKNAKTIIEDRSDIKIAINYPELHYPILDKAIEKEVMTCYQQFKNQYQNMNSYNNIAELNIDYHHEILNNRYINVVLTSFINQSNLAHPIYNIKTFIYDKKTNRLLKLNDLISQDELNKLVPLFQKKLLSKYKDCILMDELKSTIDQQFQHYENFTFHDDDLILYFNPYVITAGYCNIIKINISLDQINLKIPLERGIEEEEKVVNIIPQQKSVIDPNKKAIAITFDDGPSKYTKEVISLFQKYKGNATFFVIGNKVKLYQDTLKTMVQNGNEIANHSYNHKYLTRVTDEELLTQIKDTQDVIKKTTGITPKLFRPTYGSINKHLRDQVKLDIVMWSVDTSDWKTSNAKRIAEKALKTIKDGDIILMHDTHSQTIKALKIMLPKLIEEGYQLVTVSELNEIRILRESTN